MKGKTIQELFVDEHAFIAKTISEADVYLFAGITGDFNPAHVNELYAEKTRFGKRIAHGMLTAGLISAVIGTQLPGPGAIYVSQTLRFLAPVYIGDTITATVRVSTIDPEHNRVKLETLCENQAGTKLATGEAVVMPKQADRTGQQAQARAAQLRSV